MGEGWGGGRAGEGGEVEEEGGRAWRAAGVRGVSLLVAARSSVFFFFVVVRPPSRAPSAGSDGPARPARRGLRLLAPLLAGVSLPRHLTLNKQTSKQKVAAAPKPEAKLALADSPAEPKGRVVRVREAADLGPFSELAPGDAWIVKYFTA